MTHYTDKIIAAVTNWLAELVRNRRHGYGVARQRFGQAVAKCKRPTILHEAAACLRDVEKYAATEDGPYFHGVRARCRSLLAAVRSAQTRHFSLLGVK